MPRLGKWNEWFAKGNRIAVIPGGKYNCRLGLGLQAIQPLSRGINRGLIAEFVRTGILCPVDRVSKQGGHVTTLVTKASVWCKNCSQAVRSFSDRRRENGKFL